MTTANNKAKLIKKATPEELALLSHSLRLYEFHNSGITSLKQFDDGTSTMVLKLLGASYSLTFETKGARSVDLQNQPTGSIVIRPESPAGGIADTKGPTNANRIAKNQIVASFQ